MDQFGHSMPEWVLSSDEESVMSVDTEEDWLRLNDIRLNGQVLEYIGLGKSIRDVGFAQARVPLNTTSHYFEVEILDPGESCLIAIGLTEKDYPKHRHPGWEEGSIGYHADDGKLFNGTGVGELFGPKCHLGDIMGCGISFPSSFNINEYECGKQTTGSSEDECMSSDSEEGSEAINKISSRSTRPKTSNVEVFFTRNGNIVGVRRVEMPYTGFLPSVGMLSLNEKVRVDLRPLTG